ncbi:hypothetical protein BDZ94DRAFT_1327190 [Collybia nuda]|uniref:Uncharacterized protein n=1 Tax=Collybia nuda TaxID=64659 RepID=A0A9P5XSN0_9AGAR|nr:hypothetical protein BDZ94DRAFT_1327190 [Collybia nuda]
MLEDSGISVAPPRRLPAVSVNPQPISAPLVSGHVCRVTSVSVAVSPKLPLHDLGSSSASVFVSLPKLSSKDFTGASVLDSLSIGAGLTELEPSSSDPSDAVDDGDVDMDKTPRKNTAKCAREPTPESDAPSTASRNSKVTQQSISHSSASHSDASEPTWVEWATTLCGRYSFFSSTISYVSCTLPINYLVKVYSDHILTGNPQMGL